MRIESCCVSALTTLLSLASAGGQTTSGTIRGRVLDPQGAPVPTVTVTVTGQGNGVTRTVDDRRRRYSSSSRTCLPERSI